MQNALHRLSTLRPTLLHPRRGSGRGGKGAFCTHPRSMHHRIPLTSPPALIGRRVHAVLSEMSAVLPDVSAVLPDVSVVPDMSAVVPETSALSETSASSSGRVGSSPANAPTVVAPVDEREALAQWVRRLGQQTAFETMQVKLYERLLAKHRAFGSFEGGPTRREIEGMLDQERQQLRLLDTVLAEAGLPASVTSVYRKDLPNRMNGGVARVLYDARSMVKDCLEAVLVTEFADRRGWTLLIEAGQRAGQTVWIDRFLAAEKVEAGHLRRLWSWIRAASVLSMEGRAVPPMWMPMGASRGHSRPLASAVLA